MPNNKHDFLIDEVSQIRIDSICTRLKNSVTSLEIVNWLGNFQKNDINNALKILERLDYYSENEIIEFYDIRLKKILEKNEDKIIIHPIAEYGKSSTLMIYYLKKTPIFKAHKERIKFYNHYTDFKKKVKDIKEQTSLIFIDDFSGSGKQFINYYKTYVEPQIEGKTQINELYFLTLFYLTRAESYITKTKPRIQIIGEVKYPAFLSRGSVFGSRKIMLPIRSFSYKYGEKLFSITDRTTNQKTNYPLGYENCQALIVFAYNTPNNTLPIIWSSKNWIPLYPRVPEGKINKSKEIRKKMAHEMGLIKESELSTVFYSGERDLGWKTFSFITKTDFLTYSIIKLLKQKRTIPIICQILGITEHDYDALITKKSDIFENNTTLTEHGEGIYFEIKRKLKLVKKEILHNEMSFEIKANKYLPKNFKGVT
ncbi:hypothetical protein HZQ64_17515 [Elizabethkingia anophelis]|nr:hypothetical protein [Elizabethkingia anophelis]MCT3725376.1 hypothetical protein [Elizabethkingia anophelis]MCT3778483.1 hypothetical protein [Elizabethkingia anophelis]MCT3785620.1 hypothetical protein [Elizabethkingia anophelis]MCT3792830.1 hypothetical protein [Elizabethkingia anophelis]